MCCRRKSEDCNHWNNCGCTQCSWVCCPRRLANSPISHIWISVITNWSECPKLCANWPNCNSCIFTTTVCAHCPPTSANSPTSKFCPCRGTNWWHCRRASTNSNTWNGWAWQLQGSLLWCWTPSHSLSSLLSNNSAYVIIWIFQNTANPGPNSRPSNSSSCASRGESSWSGLRSGDQWSD